MQHWGQVWVCGADHRWYVCIHQLGRHQLPCKGLHRIDPTVAHPHTESDPGLAGRIAQDDPPQGRPSWRGHDLQGGGVADSSDRGKRPQHRRSTLIHDSTAADCEPVQDKGYHQKTDFR